MGTNLSISLVVAVAENGVIGRNNGLPWHLPDDLRVFKKLTIGHTVIVGRKTHKSIADRIGGPLPNRRTIIVTRRRDYNADECSVATSVEGALDIAGGGEIFVIGGAEIYTAFLPKAAKIYRTLVHASPDGDTFFPHEPLFDPEAWEIFNLSHYPRDDRNEYAFSRELLVRR